MIVTNIYLVLFERVQTLPHTFSCIKDHSIFIGIQISLVYKKPDAHHLHIRLRVDSYAISGLMLKVNVKFFSSSAYRGSSFGPQLLEPMPFCL